MTGKATKSTRVWRSHRGPKIYMSDDEYASTKKQAAQTNLSINRYICRTALTCSLGGDLLPGFVERVKHGGHKLNKLMDSANRGEDIGSEVLWDTLLGLEHTLELFPKTEWGPVWRPQDEDTGKRKHRGWVRGSLDDLTKIKERAELVGLSQAAFVRGAALQKPLDGRAGSRLLLRLGQWQHSLVQMGKHRLATTEILDKTMDIGMEITRLKTEFRSLANKTGGRK